MKVSHAIAEIVSGFNGMHRTSDFKSVRSLPTCRCGSSCQCSCSNPGSGASSPARKHSGAQQERRHSVIITVGADEIPVVSCSPPNGSLEQQRFVKKGGMDPRRKSTPCFSPIASSTKLKEKLSKVKRTNSFESDREFKEEDEENEQVEEDFQCDHRKSSVSSYRLI